ncbi:MAG: RNA methyltransferase [Candidatus Omnitrophica bacterium]|nr:RNA methyltransferase [Candidatus Omnitrophota bacterium]
MEKLSHEEIVSRQKIKVKSKRLPFVVLLNNIRSLYNVGSIFRTSDAAGVSKIWLCGITGHPPNNQIAKTALGAQEHVPWEYHENAISVVQQLKQEKYQIVFLEQTKDSTLFEKFQPQSPVCLIVGNEIEGVSSELLAYCDEAVEIEMDGIKNSLNVAVAFGIVAYHIRNCLKI